MDLDSISVHKQAKKTWPIFRKNCRRKKSWQGKQPPPPPHTPPPPSLLPQGLEIPFFTITAKIHARSLANFYCQYADRHMNLKFMGRVSKRGPAIRQFAVVKNKLISVFNASVLLLIMNFIITLSK